MEWRKVRAWACFWIMEAIGALTYPFPRSPTKVRVVNFLCRPFFSYGAYWALRKNPNMRDNILEMERRDEG